LRIKLFIVLVSMLIVMQFVTIVITT